MDRNILIDKLKSNNNPGEIKFYYGIRNNHLVKLDNVMLNDGIDVFLLSISMNDSLILFLFIFCYFSPIYFFSFPIFF
jgi:hypothetical protein